MVHNDHNNLIYSNETIIRAKRWKILRSEYRLTLNYIKRGGDVGADAFLCVILSTIEGPSLHDEVYTLGTHLECVMNGQVVRQHQDEYEMIQTIKLSCLAGTNNP